MSVQQQGMIESASDLSKLGIVDWNRLNGYWKNDVTAALAILNTWIVGHAQYTIAHTDLTQFPERDDWPGWSHTGNHERIGRLYWNMFQACFSGAGTLAFADAPDFQGTLLPPITPREIFFYGDIGKASGATFVFTLMHLNAGDLWISLVDEQTQIIIELLADVSQVFSQQCSRELTALLGGSDVIAKLHTQRGDKREGGNHADSL